MGIGLLVKEGLKGNMIEWREVSSRPMRMRMRMRMTLGCERCVSVAAFGPHEE